MICRDLLPFSREAREEPPGVHHSFRRAVETPVTAGEESAADRDPSGTESVNVRGDEVRIPQSSGSVGPDAVQGQDHTQVLLLFRRNTNGDETITICVIASRTENCAGQRLPAKTSAITAQMYYN